MIRYLRPTQIGIYSRLCNPKSLFSQNTTADPPDEADLMIPTHIVRTNEDPQIRKARLIYQSRKRGMLENDLLLSTFINKYLDKFNEKQIDEYDKLINSVSNDWDIYYWATNTKPTPSEYENDVMMMLKQHCKNVNKEKRLKQPNLN